MPAASREQVQGDEHAVLVAGRKCPELGVEEPAGATCESLSHAPRSCTSVPERRAIKENGSYFFLFCLLLTM